MGSASLLGKGVRVLGKAWLNGGRLAAWGGQLAVHGTSGVLSLGAEAFYFPAGNNLGLGLLGGQMNWQHYGGEVLHGIQLMGGLNLAGLVSRNLGRAIHGVNEFGIATRARGFAPVTQPALSLGAELGVVSGFNYAENGGDGVFSLIEGGATLLNIRIARHLGEALVPAVRAAHHSLDRALYRAGREVGSSVWRRVTENWDGRGDGLFSHGPKWAALGPKFLGPSISNTKEPVGDFEWTHSFSRELRPWKWKLPWQKKSPEPPKAELPFSPFRSEGSMQNYASLPYEVIEKGEIFETRRILEPMKIGEYEFFPGDEIQVSLRDRKLYSANVIKNRKLGPYPLDSRFTIYFNGGEPVHGYLTKNTVVDGVPLASGWFTRKGHREKTFSGTLGAKWPDPQTNKWLKPNSPIEISREDQVLDGTYLEPVTWRHHRFPAGVRLVEGIDGGKYAVLKHYKIGNKKYRGGWVLAFDSSGELKRAYPVKLGKLVSFFDNRLFTFTLRRPVDFLPSGLKSGNQITFYSDGKIKAEIRKQHLAGIYFPGRVEATFESGRWVEVEVEEKQTIRGLPCLRGCKLSIDEQGEITAATKLAKMKISAEAELEIVDGKMVLRVPKPKALSAGIPQGSRALPPAEGLEASLSQDS